MDRPFDGSAVNSAVGLSGSNRSVSGRAVRNGQRRKPRGFPIS